jgi:protein-S-isoprenylcysteine O-methyltransferase Ste14
VREAALAVGSVGLFWTVWAGSLLAALVVPVAVWTLILVRRPPQRR